MKKAVRKSVTAFFVFQDGLLCVKVDHALNGPLANRAEFVSFESFHQTILHGAVHSFGLIAPAFESAYRIPVFFCCWRRNRSSGFNHVFPFFAEVM
jgi:hypothetical protein